MMEKLEILIVDSDPQLREIARDYAEILLHAQELNIETVSSAEEAFEHLQRVGGADIDVIVTGNDLPNMSATEMAAAIRDNKYLNEIPIIMCSGDSEFEKTKQDAIDSGVNLVLRQPYTKEQILEVYQEVLPPEAFTDNPQGTDSREFRRDIADDYDPDPDLAPEPL